MRSFLYLFLAAFFCVCPLTNISAQNEQDPDWLFKEAREAAFQHDDYAKAIELCNQALELAPDYIGVREFLGRVYFWNQNYEKASDQLNRVLSVQPSRLQARTSLIDVKLHQKSFSEALVLANQGLSFHSTNMGLLFQRATALEQLGRYDEAIEQYRNILKLDNGAKNAANALQNLEGERLDWKVRTGYSYDWLSDGFSPWHMGIFEMLRHTSRGDIIGRVQTGNRFSMSDTQFELESYPRLSSKSYAFVQAGISGSNFFPQYRLGLSLYRNIFTSFEAEAGVRYMDFENINVILYTASLSKYIGNYYISTRGYFSPDVEGTSLTFAAVVRRYFSTPNTFLEIRPGFGSSPSGFISQQDITRLNSFLLAAIFQKEINIRWNTQMEISYSMEELIANTSRNRWTGNINLYYRF